MIKHQFVTYADRVCLIKRLIDLKLFLKINEHIPSGAHICEHIPSGFSMSTMSLFKYIGKDCMEKFFKSLREYTMEIINFKKKQMKLLTNKQQKSCENAKEIIFVDKKKLR